MKNAGTWRAFRFDSRPAARLSDELPLSTPDRHAADTWRSYWCRFFR